MKELRAIQTYYKGYKFRSRLEARWAVFFDACGVDWEYEPEGYALGNGIYYLPDFLLHGVAGRTGGTSGELYVEVKGNMTKTDADKINAFVEAGTEYDAEGYPVIHTPVLIVGRIPDGDTIDAITRFAEDEAYSTGIRPYAFNFETVDGDYFAAHPGINRNGQFELFGDDSGYLDDRDDVSTLAAYRKAKQARFEHGETPY